MRLIIPTNYTQTIPLGKVGENEVTELAFDVSPWIGEFGNTGTFALLFLRPKDDVAYVRALTLEGTYAVYTIVAADLAQTGAGSMQLRYTIGEQIVKTSVFRTFTAQSLDGDTPEPPAWETWLTEFQRLATLAEDSATAAAGSATAAEGYASDIEDMTVTFETLPAGDEVSVTKTHPEGQPYNLHFAIPQGDGAIAGGVRVDFNRYAAGTRDRKYEYQLLGSYNNVFGWHNVAYWSSSNTFQVDGTTIESGTTAVKFTQVMLMMSRMSELSQPGNDTLSYNQGYVYCDGELCMNDAAIRASYMKLATPLGNLITVDISLKRYTITPTLTNCTAAAGNPTYIERTKSATLVYNFDGTNYVCPTTAPTVTGATVTSWTKNSNTQGTLVISNPTNNVTFTVAGEVPAPAGYPFVLDTSSHTQSDDPTSSGACYIKLGETAPTSASDYDYYVIVTNGTEVSTNLSAPLTVTASKVYYWGNSNEYAAVYIAGGDEEDSWFDCEFFFTSLTWNNARSFSIPSTSEEYGGSIAIGYALYEQPEQ